MAIHGFVVEKVQHAGYEFLLYFFNIQLVEYFSDGVDGIELYVQIFVVKEIEECGQIRLLEPLVLDDTFLIHLEVLPQKHDPVSPNLVVIVGADAQNKFQHRRVRINSLLAYILGDAKHKSVSSLPFQKLMLEAGNVLDYFNSVLRNEFDLDHANDSF